MTYPKLIKNMKDVEDFIEYIRKHPESDYGEYNLSFYTSGNGDIKYLNYIGSGEWEAWTHNARTGWGSMGASSVLNIQKWIWKMRKYINKDISDNLNAEYEENRWRC